jgi:hypothetical protein
MSFSILRINALHEYYEALPNLLMDFSTTKGNGSSDSEDYVKTIGIYSCLSHARYHYPQTATYRYIV